VRLAGNIGTIQLILTAQCNSRCSYCYQTAKKSLKMEWGVLRASLELAAASPSRNIWLVFLGGEPLLEFPNIREAVAYADLRATPEKSYQYKISTNGLLIDEGIATFLDEHRFEVHLSFDGIQAAQDHRLEGSFPVIDRLLDRLQVRHAQMFARRFRICMTVIPAAVPHLASSFRYLLEKGVRAIIISPSILPHPEWSLEQIGELDEQFAQVYVESLEHLEKTGAVPMRFLRKRKNEDAPKPVGGLMCGLPAATQVAVDVEGQVYGCATLAESYQEFPSDFLGVRLAPLRMGDLRDPGFQARLAAFPEMTRRAEIFHNKERKFSSYGQCSVCAYADACAICPISIGLDPRNTNPHRVPDFFCAFNQVALKYRGRFPAVY
jgi:sulfatase maturation enzyme AslB (radical SAM superfamily)